MDLFGNPITVATRLIDTGVPIDQIAQLIVLGNIDNDRLGDILNYLDISSAGLDASNQAKQYKLLQAMHWQNCTVDNLVGLHRQNKQSQMATMLL